MKAVCKKIHEMMIYKGMRGKIAHIFGVIALIFFGLEEAGAEVMRNTNIWFINALPFPLQIIRKIDVLFLIMKQK